MPNEIKPEQVPQEVITAFCEAWAKWNETSEAECIAAALSAWPGMHPYHFPEHGGWFPAIILPLTQEASDE